MRQTGDLGSALPGVTADGRLAGPTRPRPKTGVVVVPAETDVLFTPSQPGATRVAERRLSLSPRVARSCCSSNSARTAAWAIVTVDSKPGDGRPDRGVARQETPLAGDEAARPTPLPMGRVSRCSTGRSRTMTAPWTRFRSPSTRPAPSRLLSNRRPPRSSVRDDELPIERP